MIKSIGFGITLAVFFLGFFLFYYQTNDPIGSLFAALCAALLVLGSLVVISWVAQMMRRP